MVDDRINPAPPIYQIRVRGIIGQQWSAWLGDLVIESLPDGDTLLTGPVVDQAALHGILTKIRDLNLPLLSVRTISDE